MTVKLLHFYLYDDPRGYYTNLHVMIMFQLEKMIGTCYCVERKSRLGCGKAIKQTSIFSHRNSF